MTTEPIDKAKWIEGEKLPRTTGDFKLLGFTIGQCIPPNFESYCKIFHPFEVTNDLADTLEPNKAYGPQVNLTFSNNTETGLIIKEIGNDGKEIDILERQKDRLKEYNSKKWEFVSWNNIAEKYGLIFHNEINPQTYVGKFQKIGWQNNLNFPSEGYLPRQILVKLLTMLSHESSPSDVYIYQTPPHNIWKDNKDCDLVKCSFKKVLEYFDKDFIGYLYSADKSWIVFTDTDLCFTIVGGQKKLTDILISSELEALECAETTRVDNYSDKINMEKVSIRKPNLLQKLFGQKNRHDNKGSL
jgi:hypothetical protein